MTGAQVFDSEGTFLRQFGMEGSRPGRFDGPRGVACDRNGNVIVCDTFNGRLQALRSDGVFVTEWAIAGETYDVAISADGKIYVDNFSEGCLEVFAFPA